MDVLIRENPPNSRAAQSARWAKRKHSSLENYDSDTDSAHLITESQRAKELQLLEDERFASGMQENENSQQHATAKQMQLDEQTAHQLELQQLAEAEAEKTAKASALAKDRSYAEALHTRPGTKTRAQNRVEQLSPKQLKEHDQKQLSEIAKVKATIAALQKDVKDMESAKRRTLLCFKRSAACWLIVITVLRPRGSECHLTEVRLSHS